MKKVTVSLPQGEWGSLKTKYPKDSDQVKFTDFTGTSNNFDTDVTGAITKRPGTTDFVATSNPPSDQYEAIFPNGARHMLVVDGGTLKYTAGSPSLTTVTAGFSTSGNFEFAQYQGRVYGGNGIDSPICYDTTTTYGGVTYTAPKTKTMGCLVPTAPSAALVVDSTASQVPAGAHTYKVTYLYYDAEESNGSPASGVVTADATHTKVTVTIPAGGYGVTARKVYRDNNDGNWLLLATVSNNTATTFTDTYPTGTSVVPVDNGLPPTFSKVTLHLDRLWVSSGTNTIYFSEAGLPDVFSGTGYVVCNSLDTIVAHVVYQGKLMILNRNSIGWITGTSKSNFAYVAVAGNIGCVDSRSVQIRVTQGVPTVVFLSDKGPYEYNGSALNYVGTDLEDQFSLNIQQGSSTKGRHTDDTQSDFLSGTATAGITVSVGGIVSQANPKQVYQTTADWDTGSLTNIADSSGDNTIKCPVKYAPVISSGSLTGSAIISGSNVVLVSDSGSGETGYNNSSSIVSGTSAQSGWATSFIVSKTTTISSMTLYAQGTSVFSIWADSSGSPGTLLYSSSVSATGFVTKAPNVAVTQGQKYWCGFTYSATSTLVQAVFNSDLVIGKCQTGSGWVSQGTVGGSTGSTVTGISYALTPVSRSGMWTSPTYDSACSSQSAGMLLAVTASYPTSTSCSVLIQGSANGSSWTTTDTISSPNGAAISLTGGQYRYWRVVYNLATTDSINTPSLNAPILVFALTGTWISPALELTTDATAFNSLDVVSTTPAGTSATVTIATSDDNITYTSYTALGSAVIKRYAKIKAVVTADTSDATTAYITSITLKYTVVSTQTSAIIDTGAVPAAWDVFQSTFSGAVAFWFRTAATSGGISGASWVSITNGVVPSNTVYRYVQYKATLTAVADTLPTVDVVTVNWYVSISTPLRAASLFYGRCYYLSAAEYGQTANNIVFKWDFNNKWRVYHGLSLSTLGLFFNVPYGGTGNANKVVQILIGSTDSGTNISLDVQTAAVNYGDAEHTKILRKVYVTGKNTGATYTPTYSVDNGLTWHSMVDVENGSTTYTTSSDGGIFKKRFQPVFSADNATGPTHIIRLQNSDSSSCEIHGIKAEAWVRQGEPR